ncbi:MAG: hypothetical protein NC204_03985 [Candidatus Amulumruptor caecigallinarius]|nr:hypothetical protein [Candidatus Amulumruptor caecigallinarius]
MNEIISITPYSDKTAKLKIYNPRIATKYQPGQFVIIKFYSDGHRIPFSIIESDQERGMIDVIIHRADGLDKILEAIRVGESLPDMLGPLGQPAKIERESKILFFGDGSGVVPLLPLMHYARSLKCKIYSVLSEHSSRTQCFLPDIESYCDKVVTTEDSDLYSSACNIMDYESIDKVVMSGPSLIMKRLAEETKIRCIPSECVLNMLMIDGIGLCGICRVIVGGERKQTCTDGPIFNAHLVDFDQLYNRQRLFV